MFDRELSAQQFAERFVIHAYKDGRAVRVNVAMLEKLLSNVYYGKKPGEQDVVNAGAIIALLRANLP